MNQMKKDWIATTLIALFAALLAFLSVFLAGAFSQASTDISQWSDPARDNVALFGWLASAAMVIIVFMSHHRPE